MDVNTFLEMKFSFVIYQFYSAEYISEMFLVYFGGHPLFFLAVLKNATLILLDPINTVFGVKNSFPPHISLYSYWGLVQ